jgi:hypothetical protein
VGVPLGGSADEIVARTMGVRLCKAAVHWEVFVLGEGDGKDSRTGGKSVDIHDEGDGIIFYKWNGLGGRGEVVDGACCCQRASAMA